MSGEPIDFAKCRPHPLCQKQIWLLLVPYLLGSLVLVVQPALGTVAIGLTEYGGVRPPA
jgi:ABC-type sugar transport system permease subunit